MSVLLDVIMVLFLALGIYAGARNGLIKSAVGFIGFVAILIISYALKTPVANFLIDKLPFFSFTGSIAEGLTSLNILLYNVISFVIIFIILYCILNIIISVTGFIDTLLKFTVIWIIPSKIGGAILGFLEAWLFLFLVLFVLSQFSFVNFVVFDGKVADVVLDYTPIIGSYLHDTTDAAKEIYEYIDENKNILTTEELNLYILEVEMNYGLITKDMANDLIETGKLEVGEVVFGFGVSND